MKKLSENQNNIIEQTWIDSKDIDKKFWETVEHERNIALSRDKAKEYNRGNQNGKAKF
jgi:hypothetical protein